MFFALKVEQHCFLASGITQGLSITRFETPTVQRHTQTLVCVSREVSWGPN